MRLGSLQRLCAGDRRQFPWGAREILSEIQADYGKPIRFVFNTHYHADHTFGNGVFMTEGAAMSALGVRFRSREPKGKGTGQTRFLTEGNGRRFRA